MIFSDQIKAGEKLAAKLSSGKDKLILAIPRGGVATGYGLAQKLYLPLDIIVTRKIGAPNNPELAIGAVGETKNSLWLNQELVTQLKVSQTYINKEIKKEKKEIKRREKLYRQGRKALSLKNKVVILVDDGLATGATMIAAIKEVKDSQPKKIIVAVPVAPQETIDLINQEADQVVCLSIPKVFLAVGQWYRDFKQYSDQKVINLLNDLLK